MIDFFGHYYLLALFILRLYAIYAGDRRILAFLCALAIGMVGNGLVGTCVPTLYVVADTLLQLQWYLSGNDAVNSDVPWPLASQVGCLRSYTATQ